VASLKQQKTAVSKSASPEPAAIRRGRRPSPAQLRLLKRLSSGLSIIEDVYRVSGRPSRTELSLSAMADRGLVTWSDGYDGGVSEVQITDAGRAWLTQESERAP
jgi:hypothetical protein